MEGSEGRRVGGEEGSRKGVEEDVCVFVASAPDLEVWGRGGSMSSGYART